ncbi:DNA-cytosine methyltransferase [Stanieria cyanosphaera PCC 7437]|uniref:DNA (cytosine-5-)-methyltransferase n=1 Tax=Stanieria cyanosphaera (strain ATCC 29371 / PCC 7437) TaxID=111780 RepID=K9XTJ8_STAC7|nr:DNA cytosine methyltransferase [Stanieria cyanosphaera]AFZ35925.1 DNA-cytosine methyltransferase [Stanieria cyanosphaera PCC 7437]
MLSLNSINNLNIVSLFSGCGGLDLGFSKAGFKIIWANDCDKEIWQTYQYNHPKTYLDRRDIRVIPSGDIPDCFGIIGGPPCQSWSEAGSQRGIQDSRGQLFLEYIRILEDKQPLFFLAENVSGMLHKQHGLALQQIINAFEEAGFLVNYSLLNAVDYNVPQDRKRIIFVGFRADLNLKFDFNWLVKNYQIHQLNNLKKAIWDLRESALPAQAKNKTNRDTCILPNHEYAIGDFSSIYMSRNRVRSWDEPSFTIQASGRHAPIHPQANKMINIGKDKFIFDPNSIYPYRRLSLRECARIQTFPDNFLFDYINLNAGYKIVGNAVPVNLGYALAEAIKSYLTEPINIKQNEQSLQLSLNLN